MPAADDVSRRHAVLVSFGSHGDLHPFLGLGVELKRRGFRVTLVANGRYEPEAAGHGLEFSAVGTPDDFDAVAKNPDVWHLTRGAKLIFGQLASSARPTYERLGTLDADVLIASSLAAGARVYREMHPETPLVSVHLQPTVFRSHIDPPRMPGVPPLDLLPRALRRKILPHFWNGADRYVLDPLVSELAEFRRELQLEPVVGLLGDWWHSPDRTLAMWPEWYAPPAEDFPEQARHVGFPLYDERDTATLPAELESFLEAGEPPIAFTPGSAMHFGERFFAAAVGACERLGRRGLLLSRQTSHLPASLPPSVMHASFAPFSLLLPRCAAIVHHGGVGTLSQGLAAGVPQVVMPMSHDQPDNARRLKTLGVGEAIKPRKFKARRLAKVLGRLLDDPKVAARCRDYAGRLSGVDGLASAANEVEAALAGRTTSNAEPAAATA